MFIFHKGYAAFTAQLLVNIIFYICISLWFTVEVLFCNKLSVSALGKSTTGALRLVEIPVA